MVYDVNGGKTALRYQIIMLNTYEMKALSQNSYYCVRWRPFTFVKNSFPLIENIIFLPIIYPDYDPQPSTSPSFSPPSLPSTPSTSVSH